MITSSVYVHLQRPDNGEWVIVGRYTLQRAESRGERTTGEFVYAPSYIEAGYPWVIDPINLPRIDHVRYTASRYDGLTDILRDISPDAWGKLLLQREFNLSTTAHEFDYLTHASNADRWGALAITSQKKPSIAQISSPRLNKMDELLEELVLMAEKKAAKYPNLRKRLLKTPSLGGARPKATVQDNDTFWLVKPTMATDTENMACIEYAVMQWARRAHLNTAECRLYQDAVRSAVLVKRFDRTGQQRHMMVSGASLLETEYPVRNDQQGQNHLRWSYPLLAQALRRVGVPREDLQELFARMLFNAICGNDDDHPRNHAIIWQQAEERWRLSPAFDVVPNMIDIPRQLAMQLSHHRWDITQESLMSDWRFFGFAAFEEANTFKLQVIENIKAAAKNLKSDGLSQSQAQYLTERMNTQISQLV